MPVPELLLAVYAGLVGACIGSFLNVCVYRWPADLSVVSPPSRCGSCGARIRWHDNVPVLGWIFLRGRCRDCGARISVQYPLVEAATAGLWVFAALRFGLSWQTLATSLFLTILLGIALADAKTYIIPDQFSLGGTAIGLALSFAPGGLSPKWAFAGAALGFALLWVVAELGERAFQKPAMGGGDIKMMAMIGAFLGPVGVVMTLFLGALIGTVVFAPVSWKTGKLVPFGIFLAIGAAITHVWGGVLVGWYLTTFISNA